MITLEVLNVPPTINHCYGQARSGRRYLKKEGVSFKKEVEFAARSYKGKVPDDLYCLIIIVQTNWFTKKGLPYKKDITNRVKIAEDAFAEALGIDDSLFYTVTSMKAHSDTVDKTLFILEPVSAEYRREFLQLL